MAHLVQHLYSRLNSIVLGTCFKYYSFRSLRYTEVHSSVLETLHILQVHKKRIAKVNESSR